MENKYDVLSAEVKCIHAKNNLRGATKEAAFQNSVDSYREVANYIEGAIEQNRVSEMSEPSSQWQDMLCIARFGQGFAEGLLERRKYGRVNDPGKSFYELESRITEINEAFSNLRNNPKRIDCHLRLGRALGDLGLREGYAILDSWKYAFCMSSF